jgi:hypothetical protein
MKKIVTLLVFVAVFTSCKTARVSDKSVDYIPVKSIIKNNNKARFANSSIKASMQVKYRGKDELPNINASLRMVKDSIIWLNFSKLGFPIAKLLITPKEVRGTDFDFIKVQNLFLGEALIDLDSRKFQANIKEGRYELVQKKRNPIFDITYGIEPIDFKIVKEEINYRGKNQNLTILYKDFRKISESLFPKGFLITAKTGSSATIIDVNYKNVQFDVPLKFPFKIPDGYRNIELE